MTSRPRIKRIKSSESINHRHSCHAIRWWTVKVFCGAILIAALFLNLIYLRPTLFDFPVLIAQIFVVVGGLGSVAHYLALKRSSSNISQPGRLVRTKGLYRIVRHPMYLCDGLCYSGLFFLFPNVPGLIVLFIGLYALVRQAETEDRFLERRFVEEFPSWRSRTALLVPYIY